jgi:tRNA pseudouridine55 synthase
MATGLLICLIGRATKQMEAFMGLPKTYTGTLRLGETTPSYDAETPVADRHPWQGVSETELDTARRRFLGSITQSPPMYSAVKVGGERLYKKARRGEDIPRPNRQVEVMRFDLTGREGQDVSFLIECSKGTYIRSIAHDLGQVLGVGAHLVALRRTRIGTVRVEDAWSVDALADRLAERRNEEPSA